MKLNFAVPENLNLVTVRSYLSQIFENLLSNAIKYQDPNQPTPVIDVVIGKQGKHCAISVSDNGLGVPKEYRAQLFKMFKRFHPKVATGSGLGLYLVRQNARALGGDANVIDAGRRSRSSLGV